MQYISTRGGAPVGIETAIMSGTAPDGGLYVPISLPATQPADFAGRETLPDIAEQLLMPFFAGSTLAGRLGDICRQALDFPVPLRELESGQLSVLELFHGPTAAFKDVGARFLAATMERIVDDGRFATPPVTIMVATSGDTGGAVASAYHRRPGMRVVVLFPLGRVSPRQQHQLTCWGDNVTSLAVRGEFDDCQRLVKEAFADQQLASTHRLCSANSINVGRLLPQAAYYAKASLEHWRKTGQPLSFVIPTGNLGNGFACVWARRMGLPIDRIVLATNANTPIEDYLATGQWLPRPSIATLASAMDVGNPSNMERLRQLCGDITNLREEVSAVAVSDAEIRSSLSDEFRRHGIAWCPHTATGLHVYRGLSAAQRGQRHWVVVATAHAAKFDTIVEPLLGCDIPPPAELAALLALPSRFATIDAKLADLASQL
ncbi:MAG: threonine synthase [Gammaproteobacteria bacterium]|nr:threonine synthase [Gammaproteobacteria bacterium]MCP5138634.1 threonine synthase [Chromatiales bacterium]